jgi:hypothetical protein
MKISKKDLKSIVERIIIESSYGVQEGTVDCSMGNPSFFSGKVKEEYEKHLEENVFEIDPTDSNMQQKVAKIKGDTSLYNDAEDEIKIGGGTNESVYRKSEVLKIMGEAKKNKIGGTDSYLKAIKNADRDLDYELNGPGWKAKDKAHKNNKQYDRKKKKDFLNDNINEEILSKTDIMNMILEKKYNGKVYSKSELMTEILDNDTTTKY